MLYGLERVLVYDSSYACGGSDKVVNLPPHVFKCLC